MVRRRGKKDGKKDPLEREELPAAHEIDRLIHEPARYLIMAHLYVVESADFLFIKNQTGLTFGNLSSHMSKLEAAHYIDVQKEFVDRKPHTMLKLTREGRAALENYRESMKRMLDGVMTKGT